MLSKILSKSECASCKFCCSFRRKSLWETPIFTKTEVEKIRKSFPKAKFKTTGKSSFTFDISDQYKTENPEEEALCPFLDSKKGCMLPTDLKPFDCKIWPLRAVKIEKDEIRIALTPTCPAVNKVPVKEIRRLLDEGLEQTILNQAKKQPDIVKAYSDFFKLV